MFCWIQGHSPQTEHVLNFIECAKTVEPLLSLLYQRESQTWLLKLITLELIFLTKNGIYKINVNLKKKYKKYWLLLFLLKLIIPFFRSVFYGGRTVLWGILCNFRYCYDTIFSKHVIKIWFGSSELHHQCRFFQTVFYFCIWSTFGNIFP